MASTFTYSYSLLLLFTKNIQSYVNTILYGMWPSLFANRDSPVLYTYSRFRDVLLMFSFTSLFKKSKLSEMNVCLNYENSGKLKNCLEESLLWINAAFLKTSLTLFCSGSFYPGRLFIGRTPKCLWFWTAPDEIPEL
jgi:hypothetical protein